ncbi:MAG: hypothetical protein OXB96_02635 [Candidatus Kaiserbacteria bacterium]|nr:hypothetical protein [Candidatus Kaiserbacteria bacterium]
MIRKTANAVIAVLIAISISVCSADASIAVQLGASYAGKGTAGYLTPRFSSDPAIGGDLVVQWQEYRFGLQAAQFIGLRSILGNSGHTTLSIDTKKDIHASYVASIRYQYVQMQSALPSWWPWNDGNHHEVIVKISRRQTDRWHPYALAGAGFADGFWSDTFVVVGGGGSMVTIPINQRTTFTADAFVGAVLITNKDRKIFGRIDGSLHRQLTILPVTCSIGLHGYQKAGDKRRIWIDLGLQYSF